MAGMTAPSAQLRKTITGSPSMADPSAPGRRHRSRKRARSRPRAATRPAASGPRRADHGRSRAAHERVVGARIGDRVERLRDRRAQRKRGRLEVVDDQLAEAAADASAATSADRNGHAARRRPGQAEPVGLAIDGGGRQRERLRHDHAARRGERRKRLARPRPRPVPRTGPGSSWLGTSAPRPAAICAIRSGHRGQPRRQLSIAAASADPPPIPAATGIRLWIWTRTGGASQPGARRAASASATRLGPSPPHTPPRRGAPSGVHDPARRRARPSRTGSPARGDRPPASGRRTGTG